VVKQLYRDGRGGGKQINIQFKVRLQGEHGATEDVLRTLRPSVAYGRCDPAAQMTRPELSDLRAPDLAIERMRKAHVQPLTDRLDYHQSSLLGFDYRAGLSELAQ
jgi:hypothetical protein